MSGSVLQVMMEPTSSLIGFVPKMPHGFIDLFHLERMVFHDGAGSLDQVMIKENIGPLSYLSNAFAYFSKSLLAMSAI